MSLPAIEWERCIALVGGDELLAKKLLLLFMQHLPESQQAISQAYQESNLSGLAEQVHKLYGACCYCAVPNLTQVLIQLRAAIKSGQTNDLNELHQQFSNEVTAIHVMYEQLIKDGVLP